MKKYFGILALPALVVLQTASAQTTLPVADLSSCSKPEWPIESLRKNQQGTVKLAFLVDADGTVRESKIATSSGHPLLDNAALNSVRRCKFEPGTEDGKAVLMWREMSYVWLLENSPTQPAKPVPEQILQAAQRGDAASQLKLGMQYLNGAGVPRDLPEGRKWIRKAAEQGHAPAQRALALSFASKTDQNGNFMPTDMRFAPEETVIWLGKAAEQDDAYSQFLLSQVLNAKGRFKSVFWLKKAAEQGLVEAQTMLAYRLIDGGEAQEIAQGVALLQKASAATRHSGPQRMLADCYAQGIGVEQNFEEAARLYRKAATAGDAQSMQALARLYENGTGVPKDAAQARTWAEAANQRK